MREWSCTRPRRRCPDTRRARGTVGERMYSVGWGGERWVRGGKGRKALVGVGANIETRNIVLVVAVVAEAEAASDCKIYL